jgi:hypothetical protein
VWAVASERLVVRCHTRTAAGCPCATEEGDIHYTFTVDNKEVPLTGDRVASTWVVALADGLHQVGLVKGPSYHCVVGRRHAFPLHPRLRVRSSLSTAALISWWTAGK